jgi:hypothetical protein
VRSTEKIKQLIQNLNLDVDTNSEADRRVLEDLLRAQEQSQETLPAFASPKIRRLTMSARIRSWKVAAVIAVVLGLGAISAVGVTIGKVYYRGKSADGTHHVFYNKDGEGALGDGFIMMDANAVTDVEQTRRDLEEMKSLSQQGKKELLRIKETIIGTYRMKTHEYKYQLSDGRTQVIGEPAGDTPMYSQEQWKEFSPQLKEFWGLRDAGPGEDLGTHEETVEGRVFSFQRQKYILGDGTAVIWSVGTPQDGQ